MEKKDVFLKDEGEMLTVGFQTEKAKMVLKNEISKNPKLKNNLYGDKLLKLDVDADSKDRIIRWLISWNLSWEEV